MGIFIKYEIKDTIKLLEDFFKINNSSEYRYKYDDIISKLTKDTITSIIDNFKLVVGVNKKYSETDKLNSRHVKGIKQKQIAIIFLKCIDTKYTDKSKKIDIQIINYQKHYFEIEEYLSGLTFLVDHTKKPSSRSIEISSLDSLISIDYKKIAKNVQKSLTATLTGKKEDNYFRVNPKTKDKIVEYKELGEYAYLQDKYRNIKCPICGINIKVTAKNITEKILIKNDCIVKIVCHHANTSFEEKLLFTFEIDKDTSGKNTEEKAMYVLNNYKMLVHKPESQHENLFK